MYLHGYEQPPEEVQLPGLILQIPKEKIKVFCMNWLEFCARDLGWAGLEE